ncbi:D-threo-3-hydroxyaspartate dehydratase [Paenibacillus sp. CECT 9249]|uniref:alanine racemase n=1 Tax=Paenibacillus sp. CECT 9249 TaxID=2845385 RepID=UPI001E566668|nr:alanine racemase [Paenibacillus sp. CECT 9249]CAH0117547.1 D-threo-3-hydroxyaspartate dehydratase [Paenibacillus sp. CECT 9249]
MIKDLDTPAVIVDLNIIERNISKMAEIVQKAGIKHRPHIKTHKSTFLARMQLNAGAKGITCAKLGEAEVFAAEGFDDILLAFPVVGEKNLARFQALAEKIDIKTVIDSREVAEGLSNVGKKLDRKIPVYIEIDGGIHRCGRQPGEDTVHFAESIRNLPGIDIMGVLSYAGQIYGMNDKESIQEMAKEESNTLSATADALRQAGFNIKEVSGGSSISSKFAEYMHGVTEVRAGNYIFHDQAQLATGMVSIEECALRVIVTVVSAVAPGQAVIDAGSKTLTSDSASFAKGYGYIIEHPDIEIYKLNEEHGYLRFDKSIKLSVGQKLTVIPNHSCMIPNLCDELITVCGEEVISSFPVSARGKNK